MSENPAESGPGARTRHGALTLLPYVWPRGGTETKLRVLGALAKRQRPDGSWANVSHWMEADPNLVTGYALMALSYCRPRD